jgi:hypothetical protein
MHKRIQYLILTAALIYFTHFRLPTLSVVVIITIIIIILISDYTVVIVCVQA